MAESGAVRRWALPGLVVVAALPLLHEVAGAVGVLGLLSVASLGAMWLLLRPQHRGIVKLAAEAEGSEVADIPEAQ